LKNSHRHAGEAEASASASASASAQADVEESATSSAAPPVAISGSAKPLGVAANGLQLYQGTSTWATFQNLPSALVGLACMTSINEGRDKVSVVVSQPTKVYMIKNDGWTNKNVDVSGWIQVESGMYLAEASWSAPSAYKLYSNVVPAGTHVLDTLSAIYLFDTNWFQRQQMIAAGVDDGREIVATIALVAPFQKPLAVVSSATGFQTYISGSSWGQYRNLPSYLVGTTAFTNVNEVSSGYLVSFTLNYPTMAYEAPPLTVLPLVCCIAQSLLQVLDARQQRMESSAHEWLGASRRRRLPHHWRHHDRVQEDPASWNAVAQHGFRLLLLRPQVDQPARQQDVRVR